MLSRAAGGVCESTVYELRWSILSFAQRPIDKQRLVWKA